MRPWRLPVPVMTASLTALLLLGSCSSDEDDAFVSYGLDPSADLAFVDDDDTAGDEALPGVVVPPPDDSGLPPVTTIPGPAGGAPDGTYTGILGRLAPDEELVGPAAPPPAVIPGRLPLTGLPGATPDRPAIVVKIDNGAAAVPQTGLNAADIVIEEEVEGGVSRFAAIFHSNSASIGPVRSGRTTDIALVSSLGRPVLLYSGANDMTERIIRAQPHIVNHSHATSSGYWRDQDRRAPSNLYTHTGPHWAAVDGDPPPPQFAYRLDGDPVDGSPVSSFSINYPASQAAWTWEEDQWVRSQRGSGHELTEDGPVSAANVVVIEAERIGTGMVDSAGGPVPEFLYVGTGPATIFTAGQRIDGFWTKPSLSAVATLTTDDGRVIELTPGRTWIQLIEEGSGYLR
ncbi:MAG: DUF3048 domain-containing protein [Acidimicrobiia bacterium]|nr:DUF3048 domain-containing protein [Acidimicrobiia bacterium]